MEKEKNNYFKEIDRIESQIGKKNVEKHEIICTIEELKLKQIYHNVKSMGNSKKAVAIGKRIEKGRFAIAVIDEQIKELSIKRDNLTSFIPAEYMEMKKSN